MFTDIVEYTDEHGLKHIKADWVTESFTEADSDIPMPPNDSGVLPPNQESHSGSK